MNFDVFDFHIYRDEEVVLFEPSSNLVLQMFRLFVQKKKKKEPCYMRGIFILLNLNSHVIPEIIHVTGYVLLHIYFVYESGFLTIQSPLFSKGWLASVPQHKDLGVWSQFICAPFFAFISHNRIEPRMQPRDFRMARSA